MFLKRYAERKTVARALVSGFPPKISPAIQQIIEIALREEDETTVTQLQYRLAAHGVYVSLGTFTRSRAHLGMICHGSAYCQLTREANNQKRLQFATGYLHDGFDDAFWSNETTVQLETHRRRCYRKEGEKPRPKPRPKHPTNVHVWAGISKKGPTGACIFDGIMDATMYCNIVRKTLLPFLDEKFHPLCFHRLMQDNDLKHTSVAAWQFFADSSIYWCFTPPESPDMNPLENL